MRDVDDNFYNFIQLFWIIIRNYLIWVIKKWMTLKLKKSKDFYSNSLGKPKIIILWDRNDLDIYNKRLTSKKS